MPEKTANYKLNQWKKEDDFLMKDFNADNAAVEAALTGLKSAVDGKAAQSEVDTLKTTVSAKANQSDLSSLTSTVNTKASQSALNSLTSTVNTKASQSELNTLKNTVNSVSATANSKTSVVAGTYTGNGKDAQDIYLGFQPKAVIIATSQGGMYSRYSASTHGGIALPGAPLSDMGASYGAAVTSTGFRVTCADRCFLNENNAVFYYIAWV